MSPFITARGAANSPAPKRIPVVPDLVLSFTRNAPPTVADPLMLNSALEAELWYPLSFYRLFWIYV
jgi:hypothetical protein